jgi:competence protein ComEA
VISLSPSERRVLVFIIILILIGAFLKWSKLNRYFETSLESTSLSHNKNYPLNINQASLEDLEKLPGIGRKIAQEIINYRKQFGEFKDLNDLEKIKGIGKKKLELLKPYITF